MKKRWLVVDDYTHKVELFFDNRTDAANALYDMNERRKGRNKHYHLVLYESNCKPSQILNLCLNL